MKFVEDLGMYSTHIMRKKEKKRRFFNSAEGEYVIICTVIMEYFFTYGIRHWSEFDEW
jgi:hypothetical protein